MPAKREDSDQQEVHLQALLSPDEVAHVLGVSRRRVYALRDEGVLRGIKIGRSLRFTHADLHALIEAGRDPESVPW